MAVVSRRGSGNLLLKAVEEAPQAGWDFWAALGSTLSPWGGCGLESLALGEALVIVWMEKSKVACITLGGERAL